MCLEKKTEERLCTQSKISNIYFLVQNKFYVHSKVLKFMNKTHSKMGYLKKKINILGK